MLQPGETNLPGPDQADDRSRHRCPAFTRDIYVSLGESLGGGDWSLRLYYKPFVRWIWLGGILIAIGGLLAASDKRYRMPRVSSTARLQATSKRLVTEARS